MTHKTAPVPGPSFLLTEMQAGDSLGLTPRTLQAWRHAGGGPAFVRISSRCVRYRLADLESFAADRLRSSTSDATARPCGEGMPPIFLRLPQVIARTALSRTTIYSKIRAKTFPAPVPLGSSQIVAFLTEEIDAWAADQVRASRTSCGVTAHSAA